MTRNRTRSQFHYGSIQMATRGYDYVVLPIGSQFHYGSIQMKWIESEVLRAQ